MIGRVKCLNTLFLEVFHFVMAQSVNQGTESTDEKVDVSPNLSSQKAQKTNKKKKKKKEVNPMDMVVPNLYLGGIVAYGHLDEYKIDCILICAMEIKHDDDDIAEMKLSHYKHICMDDMESEVLSKYIDDGMTFIAECIDQQHKVTLVHCMEGKSRSVSMVLGYLMKYREMTLLNAYKLCKKQRHIIRPNKAFWKSLMAMEKQLFGENSVSMKTIPSGPKAHICPYCDKNCGLSSKYLAKHVSQKHPNESK